MKLVWLMNCCSKELLEIDGLLNNLIESSLAEHKLLTADALVCLYLAGYSEEILHIYFSDSNLNLQTNLDEKRKISSHFNGLYLNSSYKKEMCHLLALKWINELGIKNANHGKLRRHSNRRGRGGVEISGELGRNGGRYYQLPYIVNVLDGLTKIDGNYGELTKILVSTGISHALDFVIHSQIIPLGLLTELCCLMFGRTSVIRPKEAIVIVAIAQLENPTIRNLLEEQKRRFQYLGMPALDEEELGVTLKTISSQKIILLENDKITLSKKIFQNYH